MFFLLLVSLVIGLCYIKETHMVFIGLYGLLMVSSMIYWCKLLGIDSSLTTLICLVQGIVMVAVVYGGYLQNRKNRVSLDLLTSSEPKKDVFFRILIPVGVLLTVPDIEIGGHSEKILPLMLALILLSAWRNMQSVKMFSFVLYSITGAYGLLVLSLPATRVGVWATLGLVGMVGGYYILRLCFESRRVPL